MARKIIPLEHKDAIVAAYLDGATFKEAVAPYGYSTKVCVNAMEERGIARRPPSSDKFHEATTTPIELQRAIIEAYQAGSSAREAAAQFGLGEGACLGALKRAGIKARKKTSRILQAHKDEMVKAYLAGATAEEAGALFGYSAKPVYTALKDADIPRRPSIRRDALTGSQHQELIEDYLAGLTLEEAASRQGRKSTTANTVLKKHGITSRKASGRPKQVPEEIRQKMADAYISGQSTINIAKQFGYSDSFVSTILKERGIQARKLDRLTKEQKEDVARKYSAGQNPSAIAQEYGICAGTVLKAITSAGVELRTVSEANQKRIAPPHFFTSDDVVARGKVRRLSNVGIAKACLLYLAGNGTHVIARNIGVHKNAINCLIKSRELKNRRKEISSQIALDAIGKIVAGESPEDVAKSFGFLLEVERPHIFTAVQEKEICRRYNQGEGCVLLAKLFDTSEAPVLAALRRHGIEPRNGTLTEEQLGEIVIRYNAGERLRPLGEEYGLAHGNIRALMQKRGIDRKSKSEAGRIYKCNHELFASIDSEVKAYLLRFIAADGCISRDNSLVIQLAAKDVEHLKRLRDLMGSNHPVREYQREIKNGVGNYCSLTIASPQIAAHVAPWGIVLAKTFIYPIHRQRWPTQP